MSKKKPHAHPEEPDHGNMAHGGCQACNELIATLRDALRVLYAECKIICVKKNLRPHPDTMAEAAAALRLEDSAGHPASAEPAVCCSSCGVTLRGPGTIHYSDCPAPSFVMPVTAWRDLGYEGPLSHAQVVEALEQIDDYTPQAAAVAQTDRQLRADLAREKERADGLEKQHRADNRLIEQSLTLDDRRKVRQLWDKYDAEIVRVTNERDALAERVKELDAKLKLGPAGLLIHAEEEIDRLTARVAKLEKALREIVGNPHVTDKSWEACIAAAALEERE